MRSSPEIWPSASIASTVEASQPIGIFHDDEVHVFDENPVRLALRDLGEFSNKLRAHPQNGPWFSEGTQASYSENMGEEATGTS